MHSVHVWLLTCHPRSAYTKPSKNHRECEYIYIVYCMRIHLARREIVKKNGKSASFLSSSLNRSGLFVFFSPIFFIATNESMKVTTYNRLKSKQLAENQNAHK